MDRLTRSVGVLVLLLTASMPALAVERTARARPRPQATATAPSLSPLGHLLAWIGRATGATQAPPGGGGMDPDGLTAATPGTGATADGGGSMDPNGSH